MITPASARFEFLTDPVLKGAFLAALEKQLNALLALDPVTLTRLGALAGRVVAFQITAPALQGYIHPGAFGIRLSGYHEGPVDAGLRGSLAAFAGLACHPRGGIHGPPGLESWGCTATLEQLYQIHCQAEPDWDALLCRGFGDLVGPLLAQGFRQLAGQASRVQAVAADNLGEYLQEELRLLPSRNEWKAFSGDIDALAIAVQRLEQAFGQSGDP